MLKIYQKMTFPLFGKNLISQPITKNFKQKKQINRSAHFPHAGGISALRGKVTTRRAEIGISSPVFGLRPGR